MRKIYMMALLFMTGVLSNDGEKEADDEKYSKMLGYDCTKYLDKDSDPKM